jgi:hypothetical protein
VQSIGAGGVALSGMVTSFASQIVSSGGGRKRDSSFGLLQPPDRPVGRNGGEHGRRILRHGDCFRRWHGDRHRPLRGITDGLRDRKRHGGRRPAVGFGRRRRGWRHHSERRQPDRR